MPADTLAGAITPEWSVPGVGALMTTRAGGVSPPPWDTMNLGDAVGDDPQAVEENRRRLVAAIDAAPVLMRQVHGCEVVRLTAADAERPAGAIVADAAVTDELGVACVVQVADCLPVLFTLDDGRAVGAAHAGWRGLAGGVLEAPLRSLCGLGGGAPSRVRAWLGPCIGPRHFEVGADVLQAFGVEPRPADAVAFRWTPRPDGAPRWHADLLALARQRLQRAGVTWIGGGRWCTADNRSRFFSFRRDGVTGRHAAAIWRVRPDGVL